MWKLGSWKGKDKWLFVLTVGIIFCILAFPADRLTRKAGTGSLLPVKEADVGTGYVPEDNRKLSGEEDFPEDAILAGAKVEDSYEAELERRVREILKKVDGVGEVDVMIVLKSSSEKVVHVDGSSSYSLTEEQDGSGGVRKIENQEQEQNTVMMSGSGENTPIIAKELRPEISGIVISAEGGGSLTVQAEISAAMEALFGIPAHKIKVLKRVE